MSPSISSCKSCGKTYFTPRLICGICEASNFVTVPNPQAVEVVSTTLFRQPGSILNDPITVELMCTDSGSYFFQRKANPRSVQLVKDQLK